MNVTLKVISVHGCWMYNLGIVITQLHITRNKRNFGEHIVHSYIYVGLERIMTSIIYVIIRNLANKLKVFNAFKETLRYGTPVVGSSCRMTLEPGQLIVTNPKIAYGKSIYICLFLLTVLVAFLVIV